MSTSLTGSLSSQASFTLRGTGPATSGSITATSTVTVGPSANFANGTSATVNTVDEFWVATVPLTASTPVSLDLTALGSADISGCVSSFAKVRGLMVYNLSATSGHNVVVGNSGANDFAPYYSATTVTETVAPSAAITKMNPIDSWVVSATAKIVKLDPGLNANSVVVVIVGCSA